MQQPATRRNWPVPFGMACTMTDVLRAFVNRDYRRIAF